MAAAKSPHVSQKIFSKRRLDWFLSIFLYLVNHRLVAESTKTQGRGKANGDFKGTADTDGNWYGYDQPYGYGYIAQAPMAPVAPAAPTAQ